MNIAYVLLGTNKGSKLINLQQALSQLVVSKIKPLHLSAIYETAAWGNTNQDSFFNAVIKIETKLNAHQLMELLLTIETKMGRVRNELKWQPRLIDLDILYFNDEVITSDFITVPHLFLHKRRFTLIPLVEIAATFIHPILKLSNQQLLDICEDNSEVIKLDNIHL
jgi:2-amino-4-hydroxy-6-hydroxymethyldihydropteridine diphosphokinase